MKLENPDLRSCEMKPIEKLSGFFGETAWLLLGTQLQPVVETLVYNMSLYIIHIYI